MNILIAMDSFKESLSAMEASKAVENGLKKVMGDHTYTCVPMADGGEGTVESLIDSSNGFYIQTEVHGPLGDKIIGKYGLLGDGKTAIIEMAEASGIGLIPTDKKNPMLTSTYGTGQLIAHALDQGVDKIILGIGGSATNDGGHGMAKALGVKFYDKNNNELDLGGQVLSDIESIDVTNIDPRIKDTTFIVACDVKNKLCGKEGASYIYGPQKGATPDMIEKLDAGLLHYATKVYEALGIRIDNIEGSGAAGGLGGGTIGFLGAVLKKGIDIVIDITKLEDYVIKADLIITGEGCIDNQTAFGKTPIGVAKCGKKHNKKVIAISGITKGDYSKVYNEGIDVVFPSIQIIESAEKTLKNGKENLEKTAENIGRLINLKI